MTFNEKEVFIMDNVIIEAYQVCLSYFDINGKAEGFEKGFHYFLEVHHPQVAAIMHQSEQLATMRQDVFHMLQIRTGRTSMLVTY